MKIQRFAAENKTKQADETLLYYFIASLLYAGVSIVFAFFMSHTFVYQAAITEKENVSNIYLPIMIIFQSVLSTLNCGMQSLLLLENKLLVELMRGIGTTFF